MGISTIRPNARPNVNSSPKCSLFGYDTGQQDDQSTSPAGWLHHKSASALTPPIVAVLPSHIREPSLQNAHESCYLHVRSHSLTALQLMIDIQEAQHEQLKPRAAVNPLVYPNG